MPPQERKRRRRRIVLVLGIALLALVSGAAAFMATREQGDVSNPDVEFRDEPAATVDPQLEPEREPGSKRAKAVDRFIWAQYGYTPDRRRYLPLKQPPRPPFGEIWQYQGNVLLEFPPVIGGKRLFLLNDSGKLLAIQKHTGKVLWRRKLGALAAASPAYADGIVYVVLLQRTLKGRGSRAGRVVALDGRTGKVRWSRELASRSESSPLVVDERLYFGSENGTVYALGAGDGRVRWRFRADGAVKGGLALADGKLYFGDYGGRVYAIRQSSGRQVWRASTHGRSFGRGGNFYSTPAVAYGRVYLGNTDGRVYSFSAAGGKLAWSKSTGGYVYSSPAVAQVPGGRPLVYVGSYSGRFYALDARSGAVRWSRGGNGRISGAPSVIGDIVYYADLGRKRTIGLGARTGRKLFEHERGSYNPVVSDGETIFLTGYHAMYALEPLSARAKKARAKAARERAARRRNDRRVCRERARAAHRGRPGAKRRSYRRCIERRPARRRKAARAECLQRARRIHAGERGKVRRSYRACIKRRGVWRH
jgi:outer membrane protein assembly factor BamB